jgi:hypothetical protein
MSTEATTPTETTTTVETSPSTATLAPSEAEVSAAIESMGELTAAQLDAIENGDFSSLAPPPADKGDGKSTPPDAGNTADTPAAAADPKSAERVHRLSLGGLPPESRAKMVQFKSLVTGGMSEAEAAAKVYGVAAPAATTKEGDEPAEEGEKQEPAATEPPAELRALEDQISAKQAEIKLVKDSFGDTTDLLQELQDLKLDYRDAKRDHERTAATTATFQGEVNKSLSRAQAEHSELWSDPKAGFESKCDDEFFLAQHKNDPVLKSPDWPEQIAKRVKEKFFSGHDVNNAGDDEDDPQIPPLPNQRVRLPGSLTGQTSAPGTITPGNVFATFDSLSEAERNAVLAKAG